MIKRENGDVGMTNEDTGLYHLRRGRDTISSLSVKEQKKHVKTFLRENLFSANLHFLIGSGCSLPAVNLMGSTFNSIKGTLDQTALGVYAIEDNKDIEGYLNWLNMALKFYEGNTIVDERKQAFEKNFNITKRKLLESIVKDYSTGEKTLETIKNYKNFYNELFAVREMRDYTPVNIFTTNYDLFNEVAMESLNIHYTNGFSGTVNRKFNPTEFHLRLVDDENRYKDKWSVVRKYVKLYKIHGSIDWRYDANSETIIQQMYKDEDVENVLIYPTINKHIETQQTPYSELFRELTINLQKPNSTLIVMGYGFPDQHINQLLVQALSNEDFNLIVFGNKEEATANAFIDACKDDSNFHFIGGTYSSNNDGHFFSNIIKYMKVSDNDA